MPFSEAEFLRIMQGIQDGLRSLRGRVTSIEESVARGLTSRWIPDYVREGIVSASADFARGFLDLLDKIADMVLSIGIPIDLLRYGYKWQTIRGQATDMSSRLTPANARLVIDDNWHGPAAGRYATAMGYQSTAASRIGTTAGATSNALYACAAAAVALYGALGAILATWIIATIGLVGSSWNPATWWLGFTLAVKNVQLSFAMISAAVVATAAVFVAQWGARSTVHGEAVDNTGFPNGRWPVAATDTFNDASIRDGDDFDWSLNPAR